MFGVSPNPRKYYEQSEYLECSNCQTGYQFIFDQMDTKFPSWHCMKYDYNYEDNLQKNYQNCWLIEYEDKNDQIIQEIILEKNQIYYADGKQQCEIYVKFLKEELVLLYNVNFIVLRESVVRFALSQQYNIVSPDFEKYQGDKLIGKDQIVVAEILSPQNRIFYSFWSLQKKMKKLQDDIFIENELKNELLQFIYQKYMEQSQDQFDYLNQLQNKEYYELKEKIVREQRINDLKKLKGGVEDIIVLQNKEQDQEIQENKLQNRIEYQKNNNISTKKQGLQIKEMNNGGSGQFQIQDLKKINAPLKLKQSSDQEQMIVSRKDSEKQSKSFISEVSYEAKTGFQLLEQQVQQNKSDIEKGNIIQIQKDDKQNQEFDDCNTNEMKSDGENKEIEQKIKQSNRQQLKNKSEVFVKQQVEDKFQKENRSLVLQKDQKKQELNKQINGKQNVIENQDEKNQVKQNSQKMQIQTKEKKEQHEILNRENLQQLENQQNQQQQQLQMKSILEKNDKCEQNNNKNNNIQNQQQQQLFDGLSSDQVQSSIGGSNGEQMDLLKNYYNNQNKIKKNQLGIIDDNEEIDQEQNNQNQEKDLDIKKSKRGRNSSRFRNLEEKYSKRSENQSIITESESKLSKSTKNKFLNRNLDKFYMQMAQNQNQNQNINQMKIENKENQENLKNQIQNEDQNEFSLQEECLSPKEFSEQKLKQKKNSQDDDENDDDLLRNLMNVKYTHM
ncbi:hypothetical protein PPERSA_04533 [Pseudocohnilembus persalinus]|uniref:Uncharacterized protein n=1 Tax=Pseudocohnilembus persalinus TaxID=266149 RepID=A0A0V0QU88_PSEPJ|nr:hypothetical protein PPERSA_04533 [Pseudocohnilembus persalinus]|eukprot:KRX05496.1 hypothetical protein PPERSA_04533 [Pseudocohnilembus persalinus]